MSQHDIEHRLGDVERDVAVLKRDVSVISGNVSEIGAGVKQLLQRDASRPEPLSWGKIGATVITMGAVLGALWTGTAWLIEHSPTVVGLERRVSRIDDKEDGKLPRIERRLNDLEAWRPSVVRH